MRTLEKSYAYDREVLLAHVSIWKRKERREGRSASERALAKQIGISHTALGNFRRGRTSGGRPVRRMNYASGAAISATLDIPIHFLMPEVIAGRSATIPTAA